MGETTNARHYRRYVVELPAEVAGVRMATANLSMEGVQVVCSQMRYDLNAAALAARPLGVRLELDGAPVELACAVRYVSGSEDEVLLGLRFDGDHEMPAPPAIADFLETRGGERYTRPAAA